MRISMKLSEVSGNAMILILLGGLLPLHANGQVQLPVSSPTPKVGDIWLYKSKTASAGTDQLLTYKEQLLGIDSGRRTVNYSSSLGANYSRNFYQSLSNNHCRLKSNKDDSDCFGVFKFPMEIGDKYEYKHELAVPMASVIVGGQCGVIFAEKLVITADVFDTVRIECSGEWKPRNPAFKSDFDRTILDRRWFEVIWYAPKVNQFVKRTMKDFGRDGALLFEVQTELTEFITK